MLNVEVGASSSWIQSEGQPTAPATMTSPVPSVRALSSEASPEVGRASGGGSGSCADASDAEKSTIRDEASAFDMWPIIPERAKRSAPMRGSARVLVEDGFPGDADRGLRPHSAS